MSTESNKKRSNVEKIAEIAAEKAIQRMDLTTEEEEIDEEAQTVGFDVFDFCDQRQKEEGIQIQYQIKKNGEVLCTKYHPYSWDKLQKEFKNGHYQVVAKNSVTKTFIRSQTQAVQDPMAIKNDDDAVFAFGSPKNQQNNQQQPQRDQPSFMEIIAMMNSASEKSRAEAREAAREQANSANNSMSNYIEMMKISQSQNQLLFTELAKAQTSTSQSMMEYTNKMFEKMNEKFEKIIEKVTAQPQQKDNGLGVLEVLKMQDSAQEKGFALFKTMQELVDLKSEEKAELLEEINGRNSGKSKSMTDNLIESILPAVTAALAGGQQRPQQMPQQRRLLPSGQRPINPYQTRPNQPRQGTSTAQAPAGNAQTAPKSQVNNSNIGRSNGSNNGGAPKTNLGLPTIDFMNLEQRVEEVIEPKIETPTKTVDIKEKIENVLIPVIGDCLVNLIPANDAAEKVKETLQENDIATKIFLQNFTDADIINIVAKYGLPKEATEWFKELYANIKTPTGNELGANAENSVSQIG